jgi:hypothetical protein
MYTILFEDSPTVIFKYGILDSLKFNGTGT